MPGKIRGSIKKLLATLLFKADPEKLIAENAKLRSLIQKQDHLKAVSTLAAGMAHEIRNPLTSIRTFAEYLPQKYDDPVFRDNFKRIVVDEVDRINNIVTQLLEFSKPTEPDLKPVHLPGLVDETLDLLSNNLLKNNIHLAKHYAPVAEIEIDRHQFKQVLLNIFLNSIQAMPHGGTLTISVDKETKDGLTVEIRDSGCGIAEADLKHIFDPFFTTQENGTGLGLSIVHGILEKHGGRIQVESVPQKGTVIRLFLKRPKPQSAPK